MEILFLDGKPFVPDPSRSAQWNRGAYLVNGLGIASECHSRAICSAALSKRSASRAVPIRRRRLGAQHHAEADVGVEREGFYLLLESG